MLEESLLFHTYIIVIWNIAYNTFLPQLVRKPVQGHEFQKICWYLRSYGYHKGNTAVDLLHPMKCINRKKMCEKSWYDNN